MNGRQAKKAAISDREESANTVIALIRAGARNDESLDIAYGEAKDAIDRYVARFTSGYTA